MRRFGLLKTAEKRAHYAEVGADSEATEKAQKTGYGDCDQGAGRVFESAVELHLLLQADFIEPVVEEGGSSPTGVGLFVAHDGVEGHGALGVQEEGKAEA